MKNYAYKVVMSTGDDIPIDADEVDGLLEAIKNGNPHAVRRGIINPSFFVAIVKDKDRMESYGQDLKYAEGEEYDKLKRSGVEKLNSIFDQTDAVQSIDKPKDTQAIESSTTN